MKKEENDFLKEEMEKAYLNEVESFENSNVSGAGLSAFLGNKGKYCTVTVECMPTCT
ncbi:lichenicidin alpha family lanthipeptide [Staphylococcus pseudintermedius]|uniref:lichenicidin alpha family lanthipeptide n=1 Tax=Staphylococcus pseudintermedius TaxID=283734 RepID=UPI002ED96AD2